MAVAYAAVLVWASGLTADPAAVEAATAEAATAKVAGVLAAAQGEAEAALTVAAAPATAAEQPVLTLALAAGMVVLAGLAYLVHVIHSRLTARRPRESVVRLMSRQITTLL